MMLKLPRFVRFLGCRHAPTTPSLGLLFNGDVVDVYQLLTREIQSEGLLQQATMEELVHGAWAKQKTRAFIDEIVDDFHRQNLPQESIMVTLTRTRTLTLTLTLILTLRARARCASYLP